MLRLSRVVTEEDESQLSNMSHDPHSCVPLVASGRSTSRRVALATKGTQESRARAIRQSLATIRLRPYPTKNIRENSCVPLVASGKAERVKLIFPSAIELNLRVQKSAA